MCCFCRDRETCQHSTCFHEIFCGVCDTKKGHERERERERRESGDEGANLVDVGSKAESNSCTRQHQVFSIRDQISNYDVPVVLYLSLWL